MSSECGNCYYQLIRSNQIHVNGERGLSKRSQKQLLQEILFFWYQLCHVVLSEKEESLIIKTGRLTIHVVNFLKKFNV